MDNNNIHKDTLLNKWVNQEDTTQQWHKVDTLNNNNLKCNSKCQDKCLDKCQDKCQDKVKDMLIVMIKKMNNKEKWKR
jgi:hypothetical protein